MFKTIASFPEDTMLGDGLAIHSAAQLLVLI